MIEVKDLVKDYGGHLAVDHLSFTVDKGQIYGFLGPNGAGKSTTMNIMTGYLGATEGEVTIDGYSILDEPEEAKKRIGYLPEIPPLYTDMTVYEYLLFSARLKKLSKAGREEAIHEAMELVKLTEVKDRLIKNLSKGYKQRVGMAQAILGKPEVIILDEPTVGLDPKQIIEIRNMIRSLGKEHTVILSSHILSEVSAVCDQILIIAHGKLVASGTPQELEQQMQQTDHLKLEAWGTHQEIQEVLNELPEVSCISCTSDPSGAMSEPTVHSLDLQLSGDTPELEQRKQLFFAFADRRVPILSIAAEHASLEDVFLELTEADTEPAAQAEDEKEEPTT